MIRRMLRSEKTGLIAVLVAVLILFEVVGQLHLVSQSVIQPPSRVFPVMIRELLNGKAWPHIWRTSWEVLASFGVGGLIGIPMGALFTRLPLLGRMVEPYLVGLYAVPLVLCYPFALVILGLGAPSIIALAAIMAFIPITLNVWIGLSEVPQIYLSVASSLQFTPWQRVTKVVVPAASPMIFAGLKMGIIYAFIGAVAMEFITADKGLGFVVAYNYDYFEAELMYAYLTMILILAALISWALLALERKLRMEMD